MNIYDSNRLMAQNCLAVSSSPTEWRVKEFDVTYTVTISSTGGMACTCLRYEDEDSPCPHILRVLYATGTAVSLRDMIGPIYLRDNYLRAFPGDTVFVPKDCPYYSSNPLVVTPPSERKIGAVRTRRFCSGTDYRPMGGRGGSLPNSVARAPP